MGNWDRELIELLPKGVKVYASAGAGFDWVDTEILAEHGESPTISRGREIRVPWSRGPVGRLEQIDGNLDRREESRLTTCI